MNRRPVDDNRGRAQRTRGHHPSAGSLRIVGDGEGTWLLTPDAAPPGKPPNNNYVGRVGALAVALGVGGVLVGLPTVAAADNRSGDDGVSQTSGPQPGGALTSAAPTGSTTASRDPRSRAHSGGRAVARADSQDSAATTAGKRASRDSLQPSTPEAAAGNKTSTPAASAGTDAPAPGTADVTIEITPDVAPKTAANPETGSAKPAAAQSVQSAQTADTTIAIRAEAAPASAVAAAA